MPVGGQVVARAHTKYIISNLIREITVPPMRRISHQEVAYNESLLYRILISAMPGITLCMPFKMMSKNVIRVCGGGARRGAEFLIASENLWLVLAPAHTSPAVS